MTALVKSICMTEIEEENPLFTQFVSGFKVRRDDVMKPRYYALKAFNLNGGPLDHLIAKKSAISIA